MSHRPRRQNRLIVICAAALCLSEHSIPTAAVPQAQSYWRAQIQEAIDSDVKHDTARAEQQYKMLLNQSMPLNNVMEVEARLAIILLYQHRSAEAIKYVDAVIKQSAKLKDRNSPANAVLAICLSDTAETLSFSLRTKYEGASWLAKAVALRRVFCNSNKAIVRDMRKLAHSQCACDDFRGAAVTLGQLAKAYDEIDVKPKDWLQEKLEVALLKALVADKIARDKHMQKTIDDITAQMSKHMTKAELYCELGSCHSFVINNADAKSYFQMSQKAIDIHTAQGKNDQQNLYSFEAGIAMEEQDWKGVLDLMKKRLALLKELNAPQIELERVYTTIALCYHALHRYADEQAAYRERENAIAAQKKSMNWMIEDERSVEQEEAKRQQQRKP